MTAPSTTVTDLLTGLGPDLAGPLILPGDAGYDAARAVRVAAVDHRPAAIVRAAGAADVARVVTFARETGLELAVRGGGHSLAGHGTSDGGIVLDLSGMRALDIDAERRTAWVQAGVTAGEYTAAAGAHGLATSLGDTASVGVAGLALSGGIGYLVRKHGLTIDDLVAAEVVTADGALIGVDAGSHPELFWALRGGGGNFGVVTRLKLRLHEVGTVLGGMLVLPATPDVVAGLVAAAQAAPDELTAVINVMPAPPLPFLAAEHHGRLVVLATLAHAGDPAAGERAVAPFRALAEPLADLVRPRPYPALFGGEPEGPVPAATLRSGFADGLERPAAEALLDALGTTTAPMAATQIRVLGGAMARVPAGATAFAHRQAPMLVTVIATHPDRAALPEHRPWVEALSARLTGDAVGVGFLGDEGEARVRAAYPGATWERLAAVKAEYDPDNLFRRNQNVPPARWG